MGDSDGELPRKLSRNFFGSAFLFLLSAFLPHPYSYLVFGLGLLILALLYALPRVGALECHRFVPRFGHMSERFALLLLIVAGEGFFKLVVTLSIKGIDNVVGDVLFNYVIGGAAIFVLCWMYFDFAGNGKPRNTDKKTLVQWVLAHLTLMLSAVMIGVALSAEVKVSFMEQYPFKYAVIGCLGLALYLYSLLLIQNVIELRTAHRFATAKLRYFGIAMAFVTLAVVSFVPSIIGNLFWFSALLSQIVVPATTAYRTFTREG